MFFGSPIDLVTVVLGIVGCMYMCVVYSTKPRRRGDKKYLLKDDGIQRSSQTNKFLHMEMLGNTKHAAIKLEYKTRKIKIFLTGR